MATIDEEPASSAGARSPSSRAEKAPRRRKPTRILYSVRNFLIYLYGVATFVGFAYAYAYYGQFGIEFLNFATVVDFIFASLANIGTLPTIILLVLVALVVLGLLLGLSILLIGLIVKKFVKSAILLACRYTWEVIARVVHAASSAGLAIVSVGEFALSLWKAWQNRASKAISEYRSSWSEYRRNTKDVPPGESSSEDEERLGRLTFRRAFARSAGQYKVPFDLRSSKRTKNWIDDAREQRKEHQESIGGHLANSLHWVKERTQSAIVTLSASKPLILSIFALFFVIATATAAGAGVVDARCILKDEKNCQFKITDLHTYPSYFVRWLQASMPFLRPYREEQAVVNQFIVPSANLAAMRSIPDLDCHCVDGGSRKIDGFGCIKCQKDYSCSRKYYSVDVRQGIGGADLPGCLVYIGAVEDAHFLAQIGGKELPADLCGDPDDEEPSEEDGPAASDEPPASGKRAEGTTVRHTYHHYIHRLDSEELRPPVGGFDGVCSYEFVAAVGPFRKGSIQFDEDSHSCSDGLMLRNFEDLIEKVESSLDGAKVKEILLIGHVDSRPVESATFGSNFALAQARAEHAYKALGEKEWAKGARVVRLPAGPRVTGQEHDDCDRSVEVHVCVVGPKQRQPR